MQKKSFFAYAIAVAGIVIVTAAAATSALSQEAQKMTSPNSYRTQSVTSSYAYVPQQAGASTRKSQCWIATDFSRGYGYLDSCANPLARDPSLDPTYNPEW